MTTTTGAGRRGGLRPLVAVAAATVAVAGSCGSADETGGAPASPVEQAEVDGREDVPSALVSMTAPGLPDPLVDPAEVRSGGPPPDGIPPIDDPLFLEAGSVDWLAGTEPVLSLEFGGEARAYPLQVMIWHEIVNDTVDGVPVAVTYCPLCNTGVAFDRRLGERVLDFGTSGRLYQSALVMYDRQTESLWSHFTGEAIAGTLTGEVLERFPVATVSWGDWLAANPDGRVLSRDTGEDRPYGQNPYPGYDDLERHPFLFEGEVDGRLAAKERVLGAGADGRPTAVVLEALVDSGTIEFDLDGTPVVAWALPGTASALETFEVADGRDVGATGLFETVVPGAGELTFARDREGFVDSQTGSRWNVLGRAEAGPLAGTRLVPVEHVDTFWFAWAAFSPDTRVLP